MKRLRAVTTPANAPRVPRRPLRAVLLVFSVLAMALVSTVVSAPARAAEIDHGTLVTGSATTLVAEQVGVVHTYRLTLPSSTPLVVDPPPFGAIPTLAVQVTDEADGSVLTTGYLGQDPNLSFSRRGFTVTSAATERSILIALTAVTTGSIAFTARLGADIGPTPLAWDTPVTITQTSAYQDHFLTLTGVPDRRLGLTVKNSTLSLGRITVEADATTYGPVVTMVTAPSFAFDWPMTATTYTVHVAGGIPLGSLTLAATAIADITGEVPTTSPRRSPSPVCWMVLECSKGGKCSLLLLAGSGLKKESLWAES